MEFKRCYGCMRELDAPGARCPKCGFDNTNDPARQPSHVLKCGTILDGQYVVGRSLGQGGFGITYLGYDLKLDMPVCIKEYYPEGAAMRSSTQSSMVYWGSSENAQSLKDSRKSFFKEAQKAVKLRNLSHVVSVWSVFYENETAYIVMDYIKGETLKDKLVRTQTPLGEKECVELLTPVMQDLDKAHERGIIHRDIKPENIMLNEEGEPVLLDMGAAKDLAKSGQNGSTLSSALVVSQGFSPREQYREHGNIGPWTDVYAMCATICYCVTGKVPPTPMDREDGEIVDLSAFSPAVARVVEKGLTLKIEDRIQTMGELLNALTAAVENPNRKPKPPKPKPPKPEPPKPKPPKPEPSKPKSKRLVPAMAVAAALLVAVGVYFARGDKPDAVLTPPSETVSLTPTHAAPASTAKTAAIDADALYDKGAALQEQKNYEGAMSAFLGAAEAGSDKAMNSLGGLYEEGLGTAKDYETAFSWFKKAADLGNADAMGNIGWLYENGYGVEQSYDTAIMWYTDGANAGSMSAVNMLGWLYWDGLGVERDYAKALQYFTRAADAGFAAGMISLGSMYRDGKGVNKDLDKALEWYLKAEEAGDNHAAYMIASMYTYDLQEYDKAIEWYNKGIEAGDCHALVGLGSMYGYGYGVEKNIDKAIELLSQGFDAGADEAKSEIPCFYYSDEQYDKALECFLELADEDDSYAMYMIGLMYECGDGVPVDYAKALEWYMKAADAGYSYAMFKVGEMIEEGIGTQADAALAQEWYRKAADAGEMEAEEKLAA